MRKNRYLGHLFIGILAIAGCTSSGNSSKAKQETTNEEQAKYFEGKLDKNQTVLVLVDFLTGFDPGIKTIDTLMFYHNVAAFTKLGNIFKLPTVVLGDEGGFRGKFYSSIRKYASNGTFIERETPSAWRVAAFRDFLKKTGRKQILLGGISLDNCTLQTSLDLIQNGYKVYVCLDVSPSESLQVEEAALERLIQAGATPVTWGSVAGELMGDWRTPEGEAVGKLYQEHSLYGGPLKPIER